MFRIHLIAAALVATASLLVAAPAMASGKNEQRVAAKASVAPDGYRGFGSGGASMGDGYRNWGYRGWG